MLWRCCCAFKLLTMRHQRCSAAHNTRRVGWRHTLTLAAQGWRQLPPPCVPATVIPPPLPKSRYLFSKSCFYWWWYTRNLKEGVDVVSNP